MSERNITKKMINLIRECREKNTKYTAKPLIEEENKVEKENFITHDMKLMERAIREKKKINEEISNDTEHNGKGFVIKSNDTQFGNLRNSQEDNLRKTLGEVELEDDALVYYPDEDNVVMNGMINGLGIKFTYKLNDKTGDGCYVTMADTQLSDANTKTIEKIRAAFQNWKNSFVEDGTIMKDLKQAAERKEND